MSVKIHRLPGAAFLAFPSLSSFLLVEMEERFKMKCEKKWGDLFYFPSWREEGDGKGVFFKKNAMIEPIIIRFSSVSECAAALKYAGKLWAPYNFSFFRRAALIQSKLAYIPMKARAFPTKIPRIPVGLWTMLDENTALASFRTSSFLPAGELTFLEDKSGPPSRAYLKLEEALTVFENETGCPLPDEKSFCFDAGASPGGWSYVLLSLGAKVFAVDRSPLAEKLMHNPRLSFAAHDAFTLSPEEVGKTSFVFSDVACYPARLLDWVEKWISSGLSDNMICTIKLQGKTDFKLLESFASLPCSFVRHLCYNKHELTFFYHANGLK